MSNALKHVQHLAGEIGPRKSTSEEEKQAAIYTEEFLQSQGVEVKQQVFKAPTTWAWANLLANLIVILGAVSYFFSPALGAFLVGLGLLANLLENDNRPFLSRLMLKHESRNVVGAITPNLPVKKKVVLVAHLDSARADYSHHPARVASFRKMYLLNTTFPTLIFLICTVGAFADLVGVSLSTNRVEWLIILLLTIPVFVVMVLLLLKQWRYDLVPGANDNASGVGVALELMGYFAKEPLKNTKILAVLTGSEEAFCNGMIAFLQKFGKNLQDAYFVNLDNIGTGTPIYAPVEGMLFPHKCSPILLKLARKIGKENPELKVEKRPFRAGYTDGSAAMVRGYKTISFLALNEKSVPPNWHWYTDTPENIEEENLATVEAFVKELIKAIDQEVINSS